MRQPSLKSARKLAWKTFSEYVRRKEGGICITCGRKYPWRTMNAGHYIHDSQDFDERNVHCQCPRCNLYFSGALDLYTLKMLDRYGRRVVNELQSKRHIPEEYTILELQKITRKYRRKIGLL